MKIYRHSPRAVYTSQSSFFSPRVIHPEEGHFLSSLVPSGRRQDLASLLSPFLTILMGLIRNTDLWSLQGRKQEIKRKVAYTLLDVKRRLRASKVRTDKLLLDEEVTLLFIGSEIKPLSSPKHRWEPVRQKPEAIGYNALHQEKSKRAVGYRPSWVTMSLADSAKLSRGKSKPL